MSEFMEPHHPFIHEVPKMPFFDRLETGVHSFVTRARRLGGTILPHEAPVYPEAHAVLDQVVVEDRALIEEINALSHQEAA